jgi:hypothetical protein
MGLSTPGGPTRGNGEEGTERLAQDHPYHYAPDLDRRFQVGKKCIDHLLVLERDGSMSILQRVPTR